MMIVGAIFKEYSDNIWHLGITIPVFREMKEIRWKKECFMV